MVKIFEVRGGFNYIYVYTEIGVMTRECADGAMFLGFIPYIGFGGTLVFMYGN